MHNMFKEEICSCCSNFITIPMCSKCSVYTGNKRDIDYSTKGEKDPQYKDKLLNLMLWTEAME